jgi:hypothetical protein
MTSPEMKCRKNTKHENIKFYTFTYMNVYANNKNCVYDLIFYTFYIDMKDP